MSQSYRGAETITRAVDGERVTVHWWITTNTRISIQSAVVGNSGTNVSSWEAFRNVVNGSFFPGLDHHTLVNSFHVNSGVPVLSNPIPYDGSRNFEDITNQSEPFEFIVDPLHKDRDGLVGFGTGGLFPVTTQNGRTLNLSTVRWGIGGMALNMRDISFNNRDIFNSSWKWRALRSPTEVTRRTAIGYLGGTNISTFYVLAVFSECEVFDVRAWLQSKGVVSVALNLDGGGSTQARGNGIDVMTSSRLIPTRIVLQ